MIAGLHAVRRRRGPLLGAFLTAGVGLLFLLSDSDVMQRVFPAGRRLAELSYDLPFAWRENRAVSNVVILYMDRPSHRRLEQEDFLDWDRKIHAGLLRRLKEVGASVVVFDVLFEESGDRVADEALVDAAREHGQVAVAALRKMILAPSGAPIGYRVEEPFLGLMEHTVWGLPEAAYEDRVVREHVRDSSFPSLARQAAGLLHVPLPTDSEARWVNYYGPPGWIPHHSYVDVLEAQTDWTTALSNQVVFVGAQWDVAFTGGRGTDEFQTPYTRVTHQMSPGVEVTATVYLNLVNKDWLRRLPPWLEALYVFALGIGLGYGLMGRGVWVVLGAGMATGLLVTAVCVYSAWREQVWFPWLIPAMVQVGVAVVAALVGRMLQLQSERRALQRELIWAEASPTSVSPVPASPSRASASAPASQATAEFSPETPAIPNHTLVRRLARGGYGEVWLARDIIGKHHAVKIVYRDSFPNAEPYEREFGGIKRFTPISRAHAGFISILHVGQGHEPEHVFYIMELGDDLETGTQVDETRYEPRTMQHEFKARGAVSLELCVKWGIEVASALEHLHGAGFVHRDLKPANIVFVDNRPKIADIGLVREIAVAGERTTYIGTKGYIPPEGPGTPPADVFGLGMILYEAAYGMKPERFPEVPAGLMAEMEEETFFRLNQVLLKACAADPSQRYQTAAALRADLEKLWAELRSKQRA